MNQKCDCAAWNANECLCGAWDNSRMTLQEWQRIRAFLFDLTDPEMFGFAVTSEVRNRAAELLWLFDRKEA